MKNRKQKVLDLLSCLQIKRQSGWTWVRNAKTFPNQFVVKNAEGDQFMVTVRALREKYMEFDVRIP